MSIKIGKKITDLKWNNVPITGVPIGNEFNGLITLEECTDYDMDGKSNKKKLKEKKRKQSNDTEPKNAKKQKLIRVTENIKPVILKNGFIVESITNEKPSLHNEIDDESKNDGSKREMINNKKGISEFTSETDDSLSVDMKAWSSLNIPDVILKALAEQGFCTPTKIQELCLPPAMLGRRDILGAAETGSGKTLAFGIPILAGILHIKDQIKSGVSVFEKPYKKTNKEKKVDNDAKSSMKVQSHSRDVRKNGDDSYETSDGENDLNAHDDGVSSKGFKKKQLNKNDSDSVSDDENDSIGNDDGVIAKDSDNSTNEDDENVSNSDDDEGNSMNSISDDSDASSSDNENVVFLSETFDSEDDAEASDVGNDDDDDSGVSIEDAYSPKDIGCVDEVELDPPSCPVRSDRPLYALILTPTRELALQVTEHIRNAGKYTDIRIATLVGGLASVKQERLLSKGPEIVVATPGRLWELIQQGNEHLQQIDRIKFLAIDETDRMVERNHFDELRYLLERLNADVEHRSGRQHFVFSATLTMVHDLPGHMKGKKVTKRGKILNRPVQKMTPQLKTKKLIEMIGMSEPKIIDITGNNLGTAGTLTESRIVCALERKDVYLYFILTRHAGRTIVFCNSIGSVKRLASLLAILKCRPLPLHASMIQRQRLKNLERFRDDPSGILIATDVAARGLDIPNVDHVIHYQVPTTAENYVHRSGRTARANREGLTILMIEPTESYHYTKLCRTLGKNSDIPTFPVPEQMISWFENAVNLAREVERLQSSSKRQSTEEGWLDRAAREMDIIVDEDFISVKKSDIITSNKQLQIKKRELDTVLSKPLIPKGFSYKYPTLNDEQSLNNLTRRTGALELMKESISTGLQKKQMRKSKNAPFLQIERQFKKRNDGGDMKKKGGRRVDMKKKKSGKNNVKKGKQ